MYAQCARLDKHGKIRYNNCMGKVILKAEDLDGFLLQSDKEKLAALGKIYEKLSACFESYSVSPSDKNEEKKLIELYNELGGVMQDICRGEKALNVYSFGTAQENHAEASRLIAKLRNIKTPSPEFIYYIQRAYELLFNLRIQAAPPWAAKKIILL